MIEPSVSAGSSQRGARVKCTAQVIWPAGAGPPVCADPTAARHVMQRDDDEYADESSHGRALPGEPRAR